MRTKRLNLYSVYNLDGCVAIITERGTTKTGACSYKVIVAKKLEGGHYSYATEYRVSGVVVSEWQMAESLIETYLDSEKKA